MLIDMIIHHLQNVLITGGTTGIGYAAALELSRLGYHVTITGRDPEKCAEASLAIQSLTLNPVDWIANDLSTLSGTRLVAEKFIEQNANLHILINNAGALFMKRYLTQDGFEKTFALNYLSPFLLTTLLLDLLKKSPLSRIINVSSAAHRSIRKFEKDNLQGEKHFSGVDAYSRSKLYNLYFTYELSSRLNTNMVTCNAVHPGFVKSNFAWNNGFIYKVFTYAGATLFGRSTSKGAETIVYLASSDAVAPISGKFYFDHKEILSSKLSYDRTQSDYLWKISNSLISGILAINY